MARRSAWMFAAGKISVSAVLLTYVAYQIEGSLFEGIGSLVRSQVSLLVLLLFWMTFFLSALRWMQLTEAAGVGTRFLDALSLSWMGLFFNQLLPTSFGGDAVRAWYARNKSTDLVRAAAIVLSDRIIGLSGLVLVISIALPLIEPLPGTRRIDVQAWLIVGLCFLGVIGFIAGAPLFARFRAAAVLESSSRLLASVMRNAKRVASLGGITLSAHILSGIAAYLLVKALWPDVPAFRCVVLFLTGLLVSTIPISYAGWGMREASIVYFLRDSGVSPDIAFKASIIYGLLLAVASLPGALFWAARTRPATPER